MIDIFTTGGTIDKIYFDSTSDYEVGDPQIVELLRDSNLTLDYRVTSLLRKDSLEMNDDDRKQIRDAIEASDAEGIVVTHGTDTMIQTGKRLQGIADFIIALGVKVDLVDGAAGSEDIDHPGISCFLCYWGVIGVRP